MMSERKKWYQLSGKDSDVVLSTRVRLARNLRGYPFPCVMDDGARAKVNTVVRKAIEEGGSAIGSRFTSIELTDLSAEDRISLVERHLISPQFAREAKGRMLLLLDDESVSLMVCEEDHLRLQVLGQGMALDEAYDTADKLDTLLSERLDFAADERLGFLTACPTNLGTAMRASVMLHLPALERSGALRSLSAGIAKLGLTIRGMYGEGSGSRGAIYQISNQETLGVTERGTIEKLEGIIEKIVKLERDERKKLLADPNEQDRMWRALGLLRSARMLSSDEFIDLYSLLRLGVAEGQLAGLTLDSLSELFARVQPATMIKAEGKSMTVAERDRRRAELVRAALGDGR